MRRFDWALDAKIERLHRLERNAQALGLENSWREIMIALGGCLIEQKYGRKHKTRL